jgi:hypothetical protein
VTFRDRLLATLERLQPVLMEPGVLIVGSEVPNLLEPHAAATLVVSQAVDVAVPVDRVDAFKTRLRNVRDLVPSEEEPSVYVPTAPDLIEANFLGLDRRIRDAGDTYVLDDPDLPLMMFGPLGLLRPGPIVALGDLRIPLPRVAGLMAEKLLTDRTGERVRGICSWSPACWQWRRRMTQTSSFSSYGRCRRSRAMRSGR